MDSHAKKPSKDFDEANGITLVNSEKDLLQSKLMGKKFLISEHRLAATSFSFGGAGTNGARVVALFVPLPHLRSVMM